MSILIKSLSMTVALLIALPSWGEDQDAQQPKTGFSEKEVLQKAETFFGDVTEGLAKAIQKAFSELGQPNAFITGEEISGAIGIGARYGQGQLETVAGESQALFWQGPSIGFDTGGNASKVLALIYDLDNTAQLYQRFPGVDGSLYFIAGVSLNYLRSGQITIAPIRTGVGARAGVSVGYLHFTKKKSWIPF